jgi:P27 family predicted phage terminase small subunit
MREWRRLVRILSRMRVLTEADADALWAICKDWATLLDVEAQMRNPAGGSTCSGLVWVPKRGFPRISPLFTIQRQLLDSIMRGLREFGLTPAARRNVQAASVTRRHSDDGLLDGQWHESETAELGAGRVPDTEGLSLQ